MVQNGWLQGSGIGRSEAQSSLDPPPIDVPLAISA
jgi:hypothetical protein